MIQAVYKCLKCEYEWEDEPGPVICPVCGHEYVVWVNYQVMKDLGLFDEKHTKRSPPPRGKDA